MFLRMSRHNRASLGSLGCPRVKRAEPQDDNACSDSSSKLDAKRPLHLRPLAYSLHTHGTSSQANSRRACAIGLSELQFARRLYRPRSMLCGLPHLPNRWLSRQETRRRDCLATVRSITPRTYATSQDSFQWASLQVVRSKRLWYDSFW